MIGKVTGEQDPSQVILVSQALYELIFKPGIDEQELLALKSSSRVWADLPCRATSSPVSYITVQTESLRYMDSVPPFAF